MKKKAIRSRSFIYICIFVLMMGFILIPQTARAADDQTIYWALVKRAENHPTYSGKPCYDLIISDRAVEGTYAGSFASDTEFKDPINQPVGHTNPLPNPPWFDSTEKSELIVSLSIQCKDPSAKIKPKYACHWFENCHFLSYIDLSNVDFSECLSMQGMLEGCGNRVDSDPLTVIFGEDVDTSKCQDMSFLFHDCRTYDPSLPQNQSLYKLDTSSCTTTNGMFLSCAKLKSIDLSKFDLSKNKIAWTMFSNCYDLTSVDMRGIDLSSCQNIHDMFSSCTNLESVDMSDADLSNCTDMSEMFNFCIKLTSVDMSGVDCSKCSNMKRMFRYCDSLKKADLTFVNTDTVTDMTEMLDNCTALEMLVIGPEWKSGVLKDGVSPKFPIDMYRADDGSYNVTAAGNTIRGYDASDAGLNIYVSESLKNDSSQKADIEALVDVLKKANALSDITDPKELKEAGAAAKAAYDALSDDMKNNVPDEALAAIQNALASKITVRWSSIDGEDLVEPFIFTIPEDGIRVDSFLWENKEALMEHFRKDGYSIFYILKSVGFKPISAYTSESDFYNDPDNIPRDDLLLTEDTTLYFYSNKSIGSAEITVDPLLCNTEITEVDQGIGPKWPDVEAILTVSGEDADKFITSDGKIAGRWKSAPDTEDYFYGTVKGGETYYLAVESKPMIFDLRAKFGYGVQGTELRINGAELVKSEETSLKKSISFVAKVTAVHDWDNGAVTKEPTDNEDGVRTYTCSRCGDTKTEPIPKLTPSVDPGSNPDQKGSDGTPVGPGASAAAAERAITNMATDDDPQGTVFGKVALKSPKQTKSSIDLSWNPVPNAASYVIFGNKCGKGNKPLKLGVVNGTRQTVSTVANQKVAKGTYYKFVVVALDRNNTVVSTSKVIHVATKGGKVGNHKKVTVKKSVIKKARKLKKGKSLKLKAKAVPQSKKLKVRKHRAVLYESSDINIATVSKKGVVKAKNKGTCYIYAYAQNGVYKKIKVTVK